jgi:predicted nucleic acid-binding protein
VIACVVDASVALKWFLRLRDDEADTDRALALLGCVEDEHIQLIQPPHFIAEVGAVLAREKPLEAMDDMLDLLDMDLQRIDLPEVHLTALELSIRYRHHLFDTLYHAVALHIPDALLITADRRYYDKAADEGHVVLLSEWSPPA